MKRVLYFFPLNLIKNNAGSIRRAWTLVDYFKKKEFYVDYAYSSDFWGGEPISEEEIEKLKHLSGIRNVFKLSKRPKNKFSFDYFFRYKLNKIFNKFFHRKSIPSFVTPYNQSTFNEILKNNAYDYIIISYAYWANLIKNNLLVNKAKLFIDTHDFLTSQENVMHKINLGVAFKDEIERLSLFDEIWVVSTDEQYLFEQFCKNTVRFMPITFEDRSLPHSNKKSFDLIYVGGENPHNIAAIKWFFKKVYPKLKEPLKICIIGEIVKYVPDDLNIAKIKFVNDLGYYYERSRLALCPMLSGTGVKVKVLEALSFGLPVICSPRGLDGLVSKIDNGCVVAHSSAIFAKEIISTLSDSIKYETLQRQAVRFFKNNYSNNNLDRLLDEIFE